MSHSYESFILNNKSEILLSHINLPGKLNHFLKQNEKVLHQTSPERRSRTVSKTTPQHTHPQGYIILENKTVVLPSNNVKEL